jgi:pimeloyl-ACP methyl ester carboxylesterase
MWGGRDRWIPPEDAKRFHDDIPGSRLIMYDRLGHIPMEEDPGHTATDAARFLQS